MSKLAVTLLHAFWHRLALPHDRTDALYMTQVQERNRIICATLLFQFPLFSARLVVAQRAVACRGW
jgi:hypothetical protein